MRPLSTPFRPILGPLSSMRTPGITRPASSRMRTTNTCGPSHLPATVSCAKTVQICAAARQHDAPCRDGRVSEACTSQRRACASRPRCALRSGLQLHLPRRLSTTTPASHLAVLRSAADPVLGRLVARGVEHELTCTGVVPRLRALCCERRGEGRRVAGRRTDTQLRHACVSMPITLLPWPSSVMPKHPGSSRRSMRSRYLAWCFCAGWVASEATQMLIKRTLGALRALVVAPAATKVGSQPCRTASLPAQPRTAVPSLQMVPPQSVKCTPALIDSE